MTEEEQAEQLDRQAEENRQEELEDEEFARKAEIDSIREREN